MKEEIRVRMMEVGVVNKEIEGRFFGKNLVSRGYYITNPDSGEWYLHHDGVVRLGVGSDSEKPAFWETEELAETFLSDWKEGFEVKGGERLDRVEKGLREAGKVKPFKLRSSSAHWSGDNKVMASIMGDKNIHGEPGTVDISKMSDDEIVVLIKELDRRFIQLWDKVSYEKKSE